MRMSAPTRGRGRYLRGDQVGLYPIPSNLLIGVKRSLDMPLPILVGDIWKADVHCWAESQLAINTFYYRVSSIGATPDYGPMADIFSGLAAGVYKPIMPATAHYIGTVITPQATLLFAVSPFPGRQSNDSAGVGTAAGALLPPNVCGVAARFGEVRGPAGRGRIFLPFPSTSFVDGDGLPTIGYIGLANNVWGVLANPAGLVMTDGDGNQVTSHPILNWLDNTDPLLDTPVTDWVVRRKFSSLHRRGQYGKPNFPTP